MLASSSNSSEWNNDDKWSSQVRKSGEMSGTSTGRPVSNKLVIDIDMDSDTAAESDLCLRSRSFVPALRQSVLLTDHWSSRKQLVQSVSMYRTGKWKYEFKKSSLTTASSMKRNKTATTADKLSLDLKFNPRNTAIS